MSALVSNWAVKWPALRIGFVWLVFVTVLPAGWQHARTADLYGCTRICMAVVPAAVHIQVWCAYMCPK